ncbi:phytanoyl-CoA dioxygenase family protein [Mycoavidus sp. B2-EB]|uniref:phytanoyl-CoA dioxygenase family protein n=1 Tax=Mycoavidus sp. B2-EB TaxID=2651972 RepID=UPI00162482F6|nr:phytanoyl-CoA dioxygenase family protein [Mycoavidus sp. B2-EB]
METIQETFIKKGVSVVPRLCPRHQAESIYQKIFEQIDHCAREVGCDIERYLSNVSRWVDPSPVTQSIHTWANVFLKNRLNEIMGQEVELKKTNIISKTAYASRAVPCHQDISYSPDQPYEFSLWFALHDVTQNDGVMEFLPYSHHAEIASAVDFWQPNFIDKVARSSAWRKNSIHLPVQAGDAILFDSRIWHRSADSQSHHLRFAIVTRWCRADYKPPPHIPEKIPADFGMWNCGQLTEALLKQGLETCFQQAITADLATYIRAWNVKLTQREKIPFPVDFIHAKQSLDDLLILQQASVLHNGGDAQGIVYPKLWTHLLEPLSKWLNKIKTEQTSIYHDRP